MFEATHTRRCDCGRFFQVPMKRQTSNPLADKWWKCEPCLKIGKANRHPLTRGSHHMIREINKRSGL